MKKVEDNSKSGKSEATATKRPAFFVWALILAMLFAAAATTAYFAFKKEFSSLGFKYTREINYGAEYSEDYGEVCYGAILKCEELTVESGGEVNTNELGQYSCCSISS